MWFTNNGGPVKIRIGKSSDCYWRTIRKGESIELSAEMGKHYGFSVKTTKGQIGNQVVETKQIETVQAQMLNSTDTENNTENFFKELQKINGVGRKTAKDIIRIFPAREELIKKIRLNANKNELPFRDNVSELLEEKYG